MIRAILFGMLLYATIFSFSMIAWYWWVLMWIGFVIFYAIVEFLKFIGLLMEVSNSIFMAWLDYYNRR